MKRINHILSGLLFVALFLTGCGGYSGNPGFEEVDSTGIYPLDWDIYTAAASGDGNSMGLDTSKVLTGNYSLRLHQGTATYTLPAVYRGDSVELKAWMATASNMVSNSRGFFLTTDDGAGELHSQYTKDDIIVNDGEWNEYSLKIPLHDYTREISFGSYIYGDGTAWVDDLQLYIDGKPLERVRESGLKDYPALSDTAFLEGSGLTFGQLDDTRLRILSLTGMVWGFVKYYHPAVAEGHINMDAELFRILPGLIEAASTDEAEALLVGWIKSLGSLKNYPGNKASLEGEFKLEPDIGWIDDGSLGDVLSKHLKEILLKRNQGPNYYITLNPGVGNPVFKHEEKYERLDYPDEGLQLLALYRYWNMIQYFFPYKNLIGEDWKDILPGYIPKFLSAGDELEYKLTVLHLIGRIHDTHANLWGRDPLLREYFGEFYAPVQLKFIEGRAVVTDYYNAELGRETGLEPGDVILAVDGEKVEKLVEERLPYYPASNYSTKLRDIAKSLLRGNSETTNISYQRGNKEYPAEISRYPGEKLDLSADWAYRQPDSCYSFLKKDIGYIYLGDIQTGMLETIFDAFSKTRGIVIDIRNYPSEFVVFSLGKYLMPEPVEFVKFSNPVLDYPGYFKYTDPPSVGEKNPDYYKGKVIILVNEITQSQAEYTTMAFRVAPRALVLGSTTAAADGNVSSIVLPGDVFTMISGIGVYYPDGEETQRVGILPDVEVRPTIRGIRMGRDELLEKAVELIENDDI